MPTSAAHTLFFAKKVGPGRLVLAFEPRRLLFQTLCGNMAIDSITNVHCWNAAVGDRRGAKNLRVAGRPRTVDQLSRPRSRGGDDGDRIPVVGTGRDEPAPLQPAAD